MSKKAKAKEHNSKIDYGIAWIERALPAEDRLVTDELRRSCSNRFVQNRKVLFFTETRLVRSPVHCSCVHGGGMDIHGCGWYGEVYGLPIGMPAGKPLFTRPLYYYDFEGVSCLR